MTKINFDNVNLCRFVMHALYTAFCFTSEQLKGTIRGTSFCIHTLKELRKTVYTNKN